MGAKRNASKKHNTSKFDNVVEINQHAKKQQVEILPRNKAQEQYMLSLLNRDKNIVFGIGPAGTGKTMIAVQVAVKMFKEKAVDRIVVTRPAVSADEDLGALPGTLEQKMAPWTRPIFDILREYFSTRELEEMILEGIIEIAPMAFMRGRTFKKSFVIADECQLTTPNQMKMLLTRLGEQSQMVITGDLEQADRGQNNGLSEFLGKVNEDKMNRLDIVRFAQGDVERHEAVKEILRIYE